MREDERAAQQSSKAQNSNCVCCRQEGVGSGENRNFPTANLAVLVMPQAPGTELLLRELGSIQKQSLKKLFATK
jgi:hypothetical protein